MHEFSSEPTTISFEVHILTLIKQVMVLFFISKNLFLKLSFSVPICEISDTILIAGLLIHSDMMKTVNIDGVLKHWLLPIKHVRRKHAKNVKLAQMLL